MKRILCILLIGILFCSGISGKQNSAYAMENQTIQEQTIVLLGILERDKFGNLQENKKVTRAQFAKMLVQASAYTGKISNKTGGNLFQDVSKKHPQAGYISFVVSQGWMNGYLGGKFKPNQGITLEEAIYSVLQLLGYTNDVLMNQKTTTSTGNLANMRYELYQKKQLNKQISLGRSSGLTRKDAMHLFYNLLLATNQEGKVYAETLGYTLDAAGEVDYLKLMQNKMGDPMIADEKWQSKIPFSVKQANIYRNGEKITYDQVKTYDVLYYATSLKTIWVYDDKIYGVYEEAQPNKAAPTSIVVAGKTYQIGSQKVAYQISDQTNLKVGMNVTLLLGRDGSVVGMIPTQKICAQVAGYILKVGKHASKDKDGDDLVTGYIQMVDTRGVEQTYDCDISNLSEGTAVTVQFENGAAVVKRIIGDSGLSGTVNDTATKIGAFKLAANANIIDTAGKSYKKIQPIRLANMVLTSNNTIYYGQNEKGEITDIILNDATGAVYQYGILLESDVTESTQETESGSFVRKTGTYRYDLNGVEYAYTTNNAVWNANPGPKGFLFDAEGKEIKAVRELSAVQVASIEGKQLRGGNQVYQIADQVVVYLQESGKYYKSSLENISNTRKYTMYAYLDKEQQAGGLVRILVAIRNAVK